MLRSEPSVMMTLLHITLYRNAQGRSIELTTYHAIRFFLQQFGIIFYDI